MNRFDHALGRKKSPPSPEPKVDEARATQRSVLPGVIMPPYRGQSLPIRIVWAEDLNDNQIDNLREQIDLAMADPDHIIITNYEVHWTEIPPV